MFTNHLDLGTEYTLGKGAEDTKIQGMVNTEEGRTSFQRELDRLQTWTGQNLKVFIWKKCEVLSLACTSPMQQCTLGAI